VPASLLLLLLLPSHTCCPTMTVFGALRMMSPGGGQFWAAEGPRDSKGAMIIDKPSLGRPDSVVSHCCEHDKKDEAYWPTHSASGWQHVQVGLCRLAAKQNGVTGTFSWRTMNKHILQNKYFL
jgi:hypothetical protein